MSALVPIPAPAPAPTAGAAILRKAPGGPAPGAVVVAVVDSGLPVFDGYEVARQVQAALDGGIRLSTAMPLVRLAPGTRRVE
jgi:hypothetical protein